MAGFPEPQVGLVISYAYLWSDEAEQGHVEGRKDRPCAIVVALENPERKPRKQVAVVPITHTPPHDPRVAIEIPPRVKQHLGLDDERSWVVLNEFNVFNLAWIRFASDQKQGWSRGLRLLAASILRPAHRQNSGTRERGRRSPHAARRVKQLRRAVAGLTFTSSSRCAG